MKKFLLKVLLFFVLVVVMDFAWGSVFTWLRSHAKGGSTANCEYIANRCEDDIIIFGSSRATHHYVPQIIEDSLGMSCYNCGEEGNGIVLAYGRFKMLTNRYKPKLVIYEMTPEFDFGTQDPNTKYLGYLRPYYSKEGVKPIFNSFDDELSFLKMQSKMYQNTGKLLPNLVDNVICRSNNMGYDSLFGTIDIDNTKNPVKKGEGNMSVDSLKLSYVEKMIIDAKKQNVPIVFMMSPKFGMDTRTVSFEPEITLCERYDIPYYNFLNYEPIADHPYYFQDRDHLNNDGAAAYTQMIVKAVLNKYIVR